MSCQRREAWRFGGREDRDASTCRVGLELRRARARKAHDGRLFSRNRRDMEHNDTYHSALSDVHALSDPLMRGDPLHVAIPVSRKERRARLRLLMGSYIILFLRYTIATFLSSFFTSVAPGTPCCPWRFAIPNQSAQPTWLARSMGRFQSLAASVRCPTRTRSWLGCAN